MSKKFTPEDLEAGWQRYLVFKAVLKKLKPVILSEGNYHRIYSDSVASKGKRYRYKSVNITGHKTEVGEIICEKFLPKLCDRYTGRYNFTVPYHPPKENLVGVKLPEDLEDELKIYLVEAKLDWK